MLKRSSLPGKQGAPAGGGHVLNWRVLMFVLNVLFPRLPPYPLFHKAPHHLAELYSPDLKPRSIHNPRALWAASASGHKWGVPGSSPPWWRAAAGFARFTKCNYSLASATHSPPTHPQLSPESAVWRLPGFSNDSLTTTPPPHLLLLSISCCFRNSFPLGYCLYSHVFICALSAAAEGVRVGKPLVPL